MISIFFILETDPFIWTLFLSSIKIDSLPSLNSISVFFSTNPLIFPAIADAQAAVPQAFVNPDPLSHTLTLIKFLLITLARVTLHFSGNNLWFSISGPIFFKSKFSIFFTKKMICGLPTFTAVPPICSVLFLLKILILRFLVSRFSLNGISFQFVFGIPISVSTKLLPKIFDFKTPEEVQTVISFWLFSFDKKKATHLEPFPHAPAELPSEL